MTYPRINFKTISVNLGPGYAYDVKYASMGQMPFESGPIV